MQDLIIEFETLMNERDVDAVEPIRMLCEALAPTGATIVLLHHARGTNSNERAVKVSRGTKALPALASNIINLSWLLSDDKTDNRIAVTTQGRSSKPVDMVIEQTDRAIWENHGSGAEIKEELKLEQVEGKLSERQSLVLTTLKEYCWEKEVGISPLTISTMLSDEYGKNGRVKALATLDQLTKKKLIIKQLISTKERGNTAVFYPR